MKQGLQMFELAEKLWPINRSLSGKGVRETLNVLQEKLTGLEIKSFKTGESYFDWTIPNEWNVESAKLIGPEGKIICNFEDNNLHLMGYSIPVKRSLKLQELQDHLYSLPDQPDAIPYVTSYYKENWGFCLSHNQREKLKEGEYQVEINSSLKPGVLNYGELLIPGKNQREVIFSTYVCHPSMANNELSGPVLASALAEKLSQQENYWSYRFLFIPETIGSISYIANNLDSLKKNTLAGYVLTCVGDDRDYSYLPSRKGETVADWAALRALEELEINYKKYSWFDRGSDERQYCAPGVDLPFCSLMRSKYWEYAEYHTSLDRLGDVVTSEGLQGSFDLYTKVIQILEIERFPMSTTLCEPQLGKRGLYPNTSMKGSYGDVRMMMDVLSLADGMTSIQTMSNMLSVEEAQIEQMISMFQREGLVLE